MRNVAVYIHWPFCLKLCPYCSFNKQRLPRSATARFDTETRLCNAIERDLATELTLHSQRNPSAHINISSLHFGGGTPSLMPPDWIQTVLHSLQLSTHVSISTAQNLEVALESSPSSLTLHNLQRFKQVGVTRVSIGIQSLRDRHLKFLGRDHSAESALESVRHALQVFNGAGNVVSVDLMYGLPGQIVSEWEEDVCRVLEMFEEAPSAGGGRHFSAYQLTYEPGTPLWRDAKRQGILDQVVKPSDSAAEMYEAVLKICDSTSSGIQQYEVSNFAQKGCESRHNLAYWLGWDYIGVGPGAHGRWSDHNTKTRYRSAKVAAVESYIEQCLAKGHGTQTLTEMTPQESAQELVVLGLRVKQGLNLDKLSDLNFGNDVRDVLDWDAVSRFSDMGLLEYSDLSKSVLRPTSKGLAVIDVILSDILVSVKR
ncbi:radical S-adenosyl methionine domain-containing protein 1 [Chytriomyces hyalinus]|nr:radical S-adenosyl methionine domain-containing protein 1 [Chytriomyces hyalinus]